MNKKLTAIRKTIKEQSKLMENGDYPCADDLISLNLQMADKEFGYIIKNALIDEFGLEKYGWKKDSDKIERRGKFDFDRPIL